VNPHLQQPLLQQGTPLKDDNPVILGLHGRNQTPDVIIDIVERMGWKHATLFAPNAYNQSWYPARFMEPIEQNEPYLTYALEALDERINMLQQQGIHKERLLLMGFSQGACLIAQYLMKNPAKYRGIAIFTGGVIGPPDTRWDIKGSLDGTPTLITSCDTDEWVPIGRVHETITLFRAMNANITTKIYQGRDHLVCDDEINLTRLVFQ
jgi:phospholipase/carboxylesterase